MPEEQAERVIGGTRRPDGTVRKEIRVRAGYVPLDEQAVYLSRGAKVCNHPWPAATCVLCEHKPLVPCTSIALPLLT